MVDWIGGADGGGDVKEKQVSRMIFQLPGLAIADVVPLIEIWDRWGGTKWEGKWVGFGIYCIWTACGKSNGGVQKVIGDTSVDVCFRGVVMKVGENTKRYM